MQWKLPDFIADRHPPGYHAYAENGIIERKYVAGHMYSTEFELGGLDDVQTTEEVYDMFVRADANRVEYWSAPAICPINTLSRGKGYLHAAMSQLSCLGSSIGRALH